jgi:hypothetical protein
MHVPTLLKNDVGGGTDRVVVFLPGDAPSPACIPGSEKYCNQWCEHFLNFWCAFVTNQLSFNVEDADVDTHLAWPTIRQKITQCSAKWSDHALCKR